MNSLDNAMPSILEAAMRAPSSHNTQPWRFRVDWRGVHLVADRLRALPVNDPEGRELLLSCGCALMHLRIAAAGLGFSSQVAPFPDGDEPDELAAVRLEPGGIRDELAPYIDRRVSYRKAFQVRPVPEMVCGALRAAAGSEGAELILVPLGTARGSIADLIVEGTARQWANPEWRRELASWMRSREDGDGLTVPWGAAPLARWIVSRYDLGAKVGAAGRRLAVAAPVLGVLTTAGDSPADWLRGGQALAKVLLEGCRNGLQASFLNQPLQIPELRRRLSELLGVASFPQALLRFGYPASQARLAPRRKLHEVLDAR